VRSTGAGTCVVTAAKAADSTYAASVSAPVTITFLASVPPALPARLTLGFAHRSHVLAVGARRAVARLSHALTHSEVVTVTGYAFHDAALARRRGAAVAVLLKSSGAHVRIIIVTRLETNKCVVVTTI
jgi:hypothetical protein